MRTIDDKATVTLLVNGEQAKKVLNDIKTDLDKAKKKVEDLQNAKASPKDIEKARKDVRKLQKQFDECRASIETVNDVLQNLDKVSLKTLNKTLGSLTKQFKSAEQGSEAYQELAEKIRIVKEQISSVKEELEASKSLWTRFKDWAFDTLPALTVLFEGYDRTITYLRTFVDAYAEMDQEMASVRKFTGMSEGQVAELNEQFKTIDTRSSREELNKLAQDAGRLGKQSVDDVMGFVRAADKINVALDDLGDGATLTLSKLTGIFGVEEQYGTEQSLLKVGSVINELSQNCSASAPYIANFTERMAGVGAQANMTIPQIMGFAAVLDSNSQKVEASATALSQVLVRLYQDPAKYAQVAGLDVKEFSDLLKKDANEALILFLETLNNAGGMDVLSPMFKDMGENGSRAIAALSTLANKIEDVKAQQEVANDAFREGTSIDTEFDVQNNTVAASLDKCRNAAHEYQVELGEHLYPLMSHFLSSTAAVARGLLTVLRFFFDHKTAVISLTVAIAAYVAVLKFSAINTKILAAETALSNVVFAAWTATTKLAAAAMALFTGNVGRAKAAWRLFNATIKASPLGLVIAAVAMLASYIIQLTSRTDEYREAAEKADASATSFVEALQKEKSEIDKLFGALEGAKKGTKEYNAAKEAIISRYGVYLQGLLNEKGEITNLALAYDRLTWAARKSAQARAISNAKDQLNNAHAKDVDDSTEALRERLLGYGMDERNVTRIVTEVASAVASGQKVPISIKNEVRDFEGKNRGFWDYFSSKDSPVEILSKLDEYLEDFNRRSEKLDKMSARQFQYIPVDNIDKQIESLTKAIANPSPLNEVKVSFPVDSENTARQVVTSFGENVVIPSSQPGKTGTLSTGPISEGLTKYSQFSAPASKSLSWSTDSANNYTVSGNMSRSMAEKMLRELTYEKSQRSSTESNYYPDVPDDGFFPPSPVPSASSSAKERFEEEKKWRERMEAEARIAYVKGEATLSEHNENMAGILANYYQKILDREDLTEDERLSTQADFWDAINKLDNAGFATSEAEEKEHYESLLAVINAQYLEQLNAENVSAEERASAEKVHQEALERLNLEHLRRIVDIYESGSDDYLKAQKNLHDAELAAAKRHRQEMEALESEYARLKKQYFGNNPAEDKALYDKQLAALTVVYDRELQAAGNNADEKLRIEKAFLEAQKALRLQYNQESESDTRNSMQKAVESSVEWLDSDGGKALTGSLSTLTSGMSAIFSGLSTMIQAELSIQTAAIESRYNEEVAYAEGNSYRIAKLEKQKEAEIAKAKNEANRKMFAMQVIQAVAQTATNALNAYGSAAAVPVVGYILAPIAAAMAVAAGAIQIASIKKQQQAAETQGYSQGGFTPKGPVDEPAGIVHAGEWVASQRLLASPVARPMIEALDYAQRTNTIGSLRSEDVSRSITAPQTISRIADGSPSAAVVASAMSQYSGVIDRLAKRLDEPFVTIATVAGDKGINKAQDDYTTLMDNKSPKSRRKNANNN